MGTRGFILKSPTPGKKPKHDLAGQDYTLFERKSRMPQSRLAGASKGEAVISYRESLATQKMGRHRLSQQLGL